MAPNRTVTTPTRFKRTIRPKKARLLNGASPDTPPPLQGHSDGPDRPRLQLTHPVDTARSTLPPEFFLVDALDLAPRLLGKFLRRDEVVIQITEVEAYRSNDTACHGRVGITPRTAPLFGPGGYAYVYLCYGMHMMLNVVADKEGVGAAVLIRSCAPICGLDIIQERRGQKTDKPILLAGPGKDMRTQRTIDEGSEHNGLYYMDKGNHSALVAATSLYIHSRLGHSSLGNLKSLFPSYLVCKSCDVIPVNFGSIIGLVFLFCENTRAESVFL